MNAIEHMKDESTMSAVDIEAVMARPELHALLADRRRFLRGAWTALAVGYAAFLVLPAVAPDAFGAEIVSGLTVGIVLALAYTALVFVLASLFSKRSRHWDELSSQLAQAVAERENVR